jgi:hypothetical protein
MPPHSTVSLHMTAAIATGRQIHIPSNPRPVLTQLTSEKRGDGSLGVLEGDFEDRIRLWRGVSKASNRAKTSRVISRQQRRAIDVKATVATTIDESCQAGVIPLETERGVGRRVLLSSCPNQEIGWPLLFIDFRIGTCGHYQNK